MLFIPRETNNMQIVWQYVFQQPFNKSSVMREAVLEFAAWNSILRVATLLTRIELNSKLQANFTDFNKSWI